MTHSRSDMNYYGNFSMSDLQCQTFTWKKDLDLISLEYFEKWKFPQPFLRRRSLNMAAVFLNTSSIFCAIVTMPFVGLWFRIRLKSFASSTIIYYTVWIWIPSISLTVLSQNGCQLARNKFSAVFFSVDFTISASWTYQSDEWRSHDRN